MAPAPAGAAAPGAAGAGGAGAAPASGSDLYEAERIACVDHINMYRATLMLPPYKRGTPEQETCTDTGAKKDGDSGQAHSSGGDCQRMGLFAQNTCPGWPLRGATLANTMKQCLDGMWSEGQPPVPVPDCIDDRQGCFQMHGHWINMSSTDMSAVSCGFYKMANGSYWMNQNFGR